MAYGEREFACLALGLANVIVPSIRDYRLRGWPGLAAGIAVEMMRSDGRSMATEAGDGIAFDSLDQAQPTKEVYHVWSSAKARRVFLIALRHNNSDYSDRRLGGSIAAGDQIEVCLQVV